MSKNELVIDNILPEFLDPIVQDVEERKSTQLLERRVVVIKTPFSPQNEMLADLKGITVLSVSVTLYLRLCGIMFNTIVWTA
jgi:hypothetical protein